MKPTQALLYLSWLDDSLEHDWDVTKMGAEFRLGNRWVAVTKYTGGLSGKT